MDSLQMGCNPNLEQLHCFQSEQYHLRHPSIVAALTLTLSVKGPLRAELRRYPHKFALVLILDNYNEQNICLIMTYLHWWRRTRIQTLTQDYKPKDYIVPCRNFHIPWSQIQISIPTANYMNGNPESNSGSESVSGNVIKPLDNAISFIRRLQLKV